MAKFKHETGDWARFTQLPNLATADFHFGDGHRAETSYRERMDAVYNTALEALRAAQTNGKDWVLFTHGWSTSRPGATTARSVIRGLMRGPESTPFIDRSQCIQHDSVFVARIRRHVNAGEVNHELSRTAIHEAGHAVRLTRLVKGKSP